MSPPRSLSIQARALQWLAQREHSRSELRVKLLRVLLAAECGSRLGVGAAGDDRVDDLADDAEDDAEDDRSNPRDRDRQSCSEQADALLDWLSARAYLSDERFVESRVRARQARFGNRRIRHELQQHGLALDDNMLQGLTASEQGRARDLWLKKFGEPAHDAASRARQMRFLAGRGFSLDVVRRVVQGKGDDGSDDSSARLKDATDA